MSSKLRDWKQIISGVRITNEKQDLLIQFVVLGLIYILAFAVRLFSVLRYESVIHEFDPYFNFRSTKFLVNEGFYNFLNWFDEASWYPLGRIVGGTIYPGLMVSAAAVYWGLNFFNITVNIRNVCVLLAPWFASNTAMVAYLFGKEVSDSRTGLLAAALLSIVPGYISRSVAGSFDNEGIAIFTMLLTYYLWIKSVNTGSLYWSVSCALAYFYMVSAWGGYVFIINLIPLHVFILLLCGRYSNRLYVAYNTFYVVGTLLAMQITFVGFQPVQSSEHLAAFGIFGLLQLYAAIVWLKGLLTEENFERFVGLSILTAIGAVLFVGIVGTLTGYISPFTGRFYTLLDPTYAKKHIPIIASVSEHQPTAWSSFFFDLHFLVIMFPVGLYYCFKELTDVNIFVILYGITSVYFTGIMVRLMLILAPIMCITSSIGISSVLKKSMTVLNPPPKQAAQQPTKTSSKTVTEAPYKFQTEVAYIVVLIMTVFLIYYVFHCIWVTSEAYSSPSIVLSAKGQHGNVIFDDFREAYYWLRHNTAPDARIMSWWDYGYQISAMANRTVLVDNNTWNNSHIAQVGKAFSSTEDVAIDLMRQMDVDYVLVIFGGVIGYSSDDINKFLWMVRIAGSTDPKVKESDYFTPEGEFRIDAKGSKVLLNCLMYKCCYYDFDKMYTEGGKPMGWDRVRNAEIGNKNFDLQYIEEAFTSEHWLVRIYRVLPPDNFGRSYE